MTSPIRYLPMRAEHVEELDELAKRIKDFLKEAIPNGPVKDLLSGTWYGEPIHPVLTDVVIGCWTSAFALDWLAGRHANKAADRLLMLGNLAAIPTAATGANDFMDLFDKQQRVGLIHAGGNVVALTFQTLSWIARKRGHRMRGRFLSLLGMGVGTASAYLGGYLVYSKGVGVNQTIFQEPPKRWNPVLDESDLPEGKLVEARTGQTGIMLYRRNGEISVLMNRCSHRGCPLSDGKVDEQQNVVICVCHGSSFRLDSGEVVQGPATAPQPVFDARINNGKVEVRPRP